MSGIAGNLSFNQSHKINKNETKRMIDAINHRGPDGRDFCGGDSFCMGVCTMKIAEAPFKIDKVFYDKNKDIFLACDGLIFNFRELRNDLIREGCQFSSESDTEVIIHLYKRDGLSFCKNLDGNFAFVLWDKKKQQLILGRDHLGVRPLYFTLNNKKVIFCSEIKGILAHPEFKKSINFEALSYFFFDRIIPPPLSIFSGIYSVNPGAIMVIKGGKIREKKYWQLNFNEEYYCHDIDFVSSLVCKEFESSIKSRLNFPINPVIAFSGGLDSSLILSTIKKFTDKPVKTLYIKYPSQSLNKEVEYNRVKEFVNIFKTEHADYYITPKDYLDVLGENIKALDNPMSMFSGYYFLSQAVRKIYGASIFFAGHGPEELFGGYWYHFFAKAIEDNKYSEYIKRLDIDNHLSKKQKNLYITQLLFFLQNYDWRYGKPVARIFSPSVADQLFTASIKRKIKAVDLSNYSKEILQKSKAAGFLNKVLELDIRTFFPCHTLQLTDRLSMINSTIPCSPFVNYRLFNLSAKISSDLKIKDAGKEKFVLKKVAKNLIPDKMLYSNFREGGVVPIREWLLFDFEKFVKSTLSPRRTKRHSFFRTEFVSSLIKEHYSNKSYYWDKKGPNIKLIKKGLDHTIKIWNLVIFQLWWENYFD